jgi:signal transduction histidine kinase
VGDKPLDTDEGAAGTAYQTGASKLVDDTDQSGISEPTHEFINSSVAVPVGSWGVFQALSTSQNAFDTQDRQLAETLVAPLATTIERFEQEKQLRDSKTTQQRQRQQIEAIHAVATEMKTVKTREEIYEMTIDAVEEILSFDICIVDEREGDVLVPKAVGSDMSIEDYYEETPIQSSDNLGSETYRTGETFVIDDLHEAGYAPAQSTYKSCISIPLGGWGIFQAAAKVEAIFDETDRRLVELLTEHTVAAVERIEREQELERRAAELERQNERLEQFASIVSHDLQNPLNVAMGYTDQTLATGETEYVENISDALDRMETIINDVLTLAKQGETVGNRETVALTDLIEDSWRQVPSETASLTVADEGTVEGDPSRLAQLFENLFRNSVEHGSTSSRTASDDSVEHGSTSSRAGPDDSVEHGSTNSRTASDDSVEHSSTSSRAEPDDSVEHAGPEVEIEVGLLDDRDGLYVEDDGSGIDEAQRDRIFDHGYTDSDDGTGFGLSIVRQIVEAHGWEIAVTDSQTGGARFEITGVDVDS